MPRPCPACLGSGLTISRGWGWFQFSSGSAAKCAECKGKGWFSDEPEPTSTTPVESEVIYEALKEYPAGLNIDDVTRITKLDIPTVYRVLMSLRNDGLVGVKDMSPILYYVIKSDT